MGVWKCGQEWSLRLFKVLARNRQSAVELFRCTSCAREQPFRMFTIPPRQRLSVTNCLAIRTWNPPHILKTRKKACNTYTYTQRETNANTRTRNLSSHTIFFSLVVLQKRTIYFKKRVSPNALSLSLSLKKNERFRAFLLGNWRVRHGHARRPE